MPRKKPRSKQEKRSSDEGGDRLDEAQADVEKSSGEMVVSKTVENNGEEELANRSRKRTRKARPGGVTPSVCDVCVTASLCSYTSRLIV